MAADPEVADLAAVDRHREAFAVVNDQMGLPRHVVENFWRAEVETSAALVKISFVPDQIFDQTPGPGAGKRL
jgi:hypothetical protein